MKNTTATDDIIAAASALRAKLRARRDEVATELGMIESALATPSAAMLSGALPTAPPVRKAPPPPAKAAPPAKPATRKTQPAVSQPRTGHVWNGVPPQAHVVPRVSTVAPPAETLPTVAVPAPEVEASKAEVASAETLGMIRDLLASAGVPSPDATEPAVAPAAESAPVTVAPITEAPPVRLVEPVVTPPAPEPPAAPQGGQEPVAAARQSRRERVIEVLGQRPGSSLGDIAAMTGVDETSVLKLRELSTYLTELVSVGWIQRGGESGHYRYYIGKRAEREFEERRNAERDEAARRQVMGG